MGSGVAVTNAVAFLLDVGEPERSVRLREMRIASMLLFGTKHPLTRAFADAIIDPDAIGPALDELDGLPALPRRRLLATLAAVLPPGCR